MVSGKRHWNAEVKARYEALVGNTSGNTSTQRTENGDYGFMPTAGTMVELERIELSTSSMPLSPAPAVRLNPRPTKLLFLVTKMP